MAPYRTISRYYRLGAPRGGVIKGGVYKRKRTRTNVRKRRQTQTNADFKLSEMGPKKWTNAHKRAQMQTKANKRKNKEFHPLLRTPFCGSPISLRFPISRDTFSGRVGSCQDGALPPLGAQFHTGTSVQYTISQHIAEQP